MFEVDPSAVDFDLESLLWFFAEMSSSVDSPTYEPDSELILTFNVEMSRKLFELDPMLKVNPKTVDLDSELILRFQVKILKKTSDFDPADFMISSWNVEKDQLTLILIHFMISGWNVEEN